MPAQVRMVIHEAVRINRHIVAVFVAPEQIVIQLLGPRLGEQPILIMALPCHMKVTVISQNR